MEYIIVVITSTSFIGENLMSSVSTGSCVFSVNTCQSVAVESIYLHDGYNLQQCLLRLNLDLLFILGGMFQTVKYISTNLGYCSVIDSHITALK